MRLFAMKVSDHYLMYVFACKIPVFCGMKMNVWLPFICLKTSQFSFCDYYWINNRLFYCLQLFCIAFIWYFIYLINDMNIFYIQFFFSAVHNIMSKFLLYT